MGDDAAAEFTFVCPQCEESLVVNGSMRDALLDKGCVICSAPLTAAAFSDCQPANRS